MSNDSTWKQKTLQSKFLKETDSSYYAVIDLQHALEDDRNRNIALTGPFGAGKSSVIYTLKEKEENKKRWKFLSISLATLDAVDDSNKTDNVTLEHKKKSNDTEQLNRRIEYSILQQLIYREKSETLPNSRLKRIPYIPNDTIKKITLSILLFIICFFIVFEPKWCKVEILYRIFNWGYCLNGIFDMISLMVMGYIIYKGLNKLIAFSGNARLNQLKIAGSEIHIKEENSIFNHHLDEILYFFQCTTYDVVIIEDLDRFNTTDIFLKLRELNYLINESQIINRTIKFIYAIKDDMFPDSSRTKFFDYITTVIPIISSYNSKDILRNTLAELGHEDEINDETIKEVAFFIDDMRLLLNIVNEYHQYRLRLRCEDSHQIDNNKLLGMIVYKNYYPNDFSFLPKHDGKLYSALCQNQKREYIEIAINKVLAKREEQAKKKLEALHAVQHLKAKELRMIYVMAYVNKMSSTVVSIKVGNINKPLSYFWESEKAFNSLISQNKVEYLYYTGNSYSTSSSYFTIPFSAIEKEVDSTYTYKERIDAIKVGEDKINQELADIDMEKLMIGSYTISMLIMKFSLYQEECYKQINLPEMADRFIRIGLIAEDYNDYISYFYPGMVSANDHRLALNMKLDRRPDYREHIDNVKVFLDELSDDVFLTQSIYNVELLDYLVSHPVLEEKRYSLFLHKLSENNPFDFLFVYYKEGKNVGAVLERYIQKNPHGIWNLIASITDVDNEKIMREIWLKYCLINHISDVQLEWINFHFEFISALYPNFSEEKQKFFTTKPCYSTLSENSVDMLEAVIENERYSISKDTIPIVFKYKNAYDNIGLVSFEEQTAAFQLELPYPTWKNVSLYYKNNDEIIDNALWNFIKNRIEDLSSSEYDGEVDMEESLFNSIMNGNILTFDNYMRIAEPFKGNTYNLTNETKQLEEKRICWLIKNGFVKYFESDIEFIQGFSNKVIFEYIIYNKSHFASNVDKYNYNESLVIMLLNTNELSNKEKALVLKHLNPDSINMTEILSDAICKLLLIQTVEWDYSLLKQALSMSSDKDTVLQIIIYTIRNNRENSNLITDLLQLLPDPYYKITEKGKRPIIESTLLNKALLDELKDANYISTYMQEEKGYRVNTRQKND